MPKRYEQLADFVDDPDFRRWVLEARPEDVRHWEAWLRQHPDRRSLVEEAREIVLGIPARPLPAEEAAKAAVWAQIEAVMRRQILPARTRALRAWTVAASILLLLGSGGLFWWLVQAPSYQTIATAYGETREVVLPDGSQVTLNAHSSLRYLDSWAESATREVWLEGEAFFSVEKSPEGKAFRVYSSDLKVEVLGTEFNVRQRGAETEVTLEEGSVELSHLASRQKVRLVPGEQAIYAGKGATIETRTTAVENHSAWRDHLLVFDEMPMGEVAQRIEETFGMPVVVQTEALQKRTLSGRISTADLEVMLEALSLTFSLQIETREDTIFLQP